MNEVNNSQNQNVLIENTELSEQQLIRMLIMSKEDQVAEWDDNGGDGDDDDDDDLLAVD